MNILIVEDEFTLLNSVEMQLQGFALTSKSKIFSERGINGAQRRISSTDFIDLAIIDLRLPSQSGINDDAGFEIIGQLQDAQKRSGKSTPVIVLSSRNDTLATSRAMTYGNVRSYLTKPWARQELLHAVEQCLPVTHKSDPVPPLNERKEYGESAVHETLRNDFERHIQQSLSCFKDVSDHSSESEVLTFVSRKLFEPHRWAKAVALVTLGQNESVEPLTCHGNEANRLHSLLKTDTDLTAQIYQCITKEDRGQYRLDQHDGFGVALIQSITGTGAKTFLIVVVDDSTSVLRSLVATAALFIGAIAGIFNQQNARREIMSMMSHMCAGHIAVSRHHIEQAEKLLPNAPQSLVSDLQPHLSTATTELNNAGIALRKAAIWSSDDSPLTEEVCIEQELKCVVEQLQFGPLVDDSFQKCLSNLRTIRIVASRSRLQQCLRDSLIGTWILSRRNSLGLHAEFKPSDDGGKSVTLHICGKDSTIPSGWSDDRVKRTFFDPEIFFLTSTKGIEERALTFDCTRRLLRQMNADMTPSLQDDRFRLSIHFHECRTT